MSYKSGYQGGPYFELFSTQGRDFLANWKGSSSGIKKTYEKDVKGYVLTLEGAPATTKLQSPKDQKQNLTLVQRFLVLQVCLSKGADFSVELGVTDLGNNKRRILLSTAQKETQVTPLHAKVPLTIVRRAVWLNLVLDMVSLTGETWTSQTFRSIDQISISANCKLRRVFTMKSQPPDTTDDDELYGCSSTNNSELDNIPKQCQMAPDVMQLTQVLTLNKIKCAERFKSGKASGLLEQFRPGSTLDLDLNASGRKIQTSDGKIAFGTKAPRAPDTGRKTSRQGSITNRSFRSQTSRNDANSSTSVPGTSDSIYSHDGLGAGGDNFDIPRPRPPASASAVSSVSGASTAAVSYNRQQSEPVTQEDYGYLVNGAGLKDKQIVVPHPPREPSTDRVRRRPRIKSIGQNGVLNKGESSVASPPASGQIGSRGATAQPPTSTHSPGTSHIGQRSGGEVRVTHNKMRDSGVGPDVPEIQSPRKGDINNPSESSIYTEYDSVADVISLLKGVEPRLAEETNSIIASNNTSVNNYSITNSFSRQRKNEEEINGEKERRRKETVKVDSKKEPEMNGKRPSAIDDDDTNSSASGSESSHPGEYEESDEETSGEKNKLHFFVSPPKSASIRRNISPSTGDLDSNQSRRGSVKSFRSNVKRNTDTASNRGARLEDDFVSHSSSDDDPTAGADLLHHNIRARRIGGTTGGPTYRHHHTSSTSGYNSSNYTSSFTSSPKSRDQSERSGVNRPRYTSAMIPQTSASPDQKVFDPKLYSDTEGRGRDSKLGSVSRMSRKSLREINNPHSDSFTVKKSNEKAYDFSKYQIDLTESETTRMFASMRRQGEEAMEDVSPPPNLRNSQHHLNPSDTIMTHLYNESPATTSDDDTTSSTWKAPAQNQAPHNYQDEMKSRRSSDTLTSSNPRDWSSVMSPPIVPLSGVKDLQGTMEGISDDLTDEVVPSQVSYQSNLRSGDDEEKMLDLIFDPNLNCYRDPKTNKWYELRPDH